MLQACLVADQRLRHHLITGLIRHLAAETESLHFALRLEDALDEVEHLERAELLAVRAELAHLDLLHGEHVVHQTEQEVQLGDDQVDGALRPLVERVGVRLEHLLEKHERGADRSPELVRYSACVALQRLVAVLFLEKLAL